MAQPFLTPQFFRVDFGQGLNTKQNAKTLSTGEMTTLQNVRFVKDNQLSKRWGFTSIGSSDDGNIIYQLNSFNNNVWGIGTSLSPPSMTAPLRGVYQLGSLGGSYIYTGPSFNDCQITSQPVIINENYQEQADSASVNGYTCHAWTDFSDNGSYPAIYYEVVLTSNGQVIVPPTVLQAASALAGYDVRVIVLGNKFFIGWSGIGGTTKINVFTTDTSSSFATTGPISLSNYHPSGAAAYGNWDWVSHNTGSVTSQCVLMAYQSSASQLSFANISYTGTFSKLQSLTTNSSFSFNTLGMIQPYGPTSITFNTVYVDNSLDKLWNIAMNQSLTGVVSVSSGFSITSTFLITGQENSYGNFIAFVNNQQQTTPFAANMISPLVYTASSKTWTNTGYPLHGLNIHSKPIFNNDNSIYFWTLYNSTIQGQYILQQYLPNPGTFYGATSNTAIMVPTARILAGQAMTPWAITNPITKIATNVSSITTNQYQTDCIVIGQQLPNATGFGQFPSISQLNMNFTPNYNATILNNQQIVSGGFLFDGNQMTELGFLVYPEGYTASVTTTSGHLGSGTYQYVVTYAWTDQQGNYHESETGIPLSVTTSTTTSAVTLTIPTLRTTLKTNLLYSGVSLAQINVYRNIVNASPSIFYNIATVTSNFNNSQAESISVIDTISDANLAYNKLLYTTGGVEDHYTIDGTNVMCAGPDRLFASDPNNNGIVHIGTQYTPTDGLSFISGITQLLPVNGNDGPITAMVQLDDNLVVFYARSVWICQGIGPTPTGANNQLTPFQRITSDIGCTGPNNICVTPDGLIVFTNKGFFKIGHDLSFQDPTNYIGAKVESFNSLGCLRSVSVPDQAEARFLMGDNATVLRYNYHYQKWSEDVYSSDGVGLVNDLLSLNGNVYMACTSTGASNSSLVVQETPNLFFDSMTNASVSTAVPFNMTTGYFALNNLQGAQRVYRVRILGDFKSTHSLQVSLDYNYAGTFADVHTISSNNITYNGSTYQAELFVPLAYQRCQSIALNIIDTSITGESFDLVDIEFEVGIEQGKRYPLYPQQGF